MTKKRRREKSFKGCTPCKIARRKCPEERPACSQCIKTGTECKYDLDSVLRIQHFANGKLDAKQGGPKTRQSVVLVASPRSTPDRTRSINGQNFLTQEVLCQTSSPSIGSRGKPAILETEEDQRSSVPAVRSPFRQLSVADEDVINPFCNRYFLLSSSALPQVLPYASLFPSIVCDIVSYSVFHVPLRHSVLSISSMVTDYCDTDRADRFHQQYITSLQKIQNAIQYMDIDEGTIISIFLLACIDVARMEYEWSRKHLQGLYQLFQLLQRKNFRRDTGQYLLDQIWQIAIRLDWVISLYTAEPPVFPMYPHPQNWRPPKIIPCHLDGYTVDRALAAFAQDCLMHEACSLAVRARRIRKSPNYTPDLELGILDSAKLLEKRNQEWHHHRIVDIGRHSDESDERSQEPVCDASTISEKSASFLDYPERPADHTFYANLEMTSHAISIYISLIVHPIIGRSREHPQFTDAVEICRTLAGLGHNGPETAISQIWVMCLAGVAFGGLRRAEKEVNWLRRRMDLAVGKFPLKHVPYAYEQLWDAEGDFWDEMERMKKNVYQ